MDVQNHLKVFCVFNVKLSFTISRVQVLKLLKQTLVLYVSLAKLSMVHYGSEGFFT